jgi:hypothetical protein
MKRYTIRGKKIYKKNKKSKRKFKINLKYGGGKTNALCLLIKSPNTIWLDFLNGFTDIYDIYIMIDDNTVDIKALGLTYPGITCLQINNEECKNAKYWDLNYFLGKEVTSWEKAIYYFCTKNTSYEYVWFCEEDVFIHNKDILVNIDKKHNSADLLCTDLIYNTSGELKSWWHWYKAKKVFKLPWRAGLVCLCRMSRKLLEKVKAFAEEHNKLDFLEMLFPTLADHNNMLIEEPEEFSGIQYPAISESTIYNFNKIYHAIKNIEQHKILRNKNAISH